MKKYFLVFTAFYFILNSAYAETTIDVVENTLKIGGTKEEIFYYGFAEGDQIIFNFEEVNGKELKEVEIIEYPSSSKFMDYKTKKIENKTLTVSKTGIYMFRFHNSAVMGRICKIKIQRIPADESTHKFNTSVYWKTIYDTTFNTQMEKYLISKDTLIHNLTDQVAKVHSQLNLNGSKTSFNFFLPANTVSWSYYIGVDQSGKAAYESAVTKLAKVASPILSRMPGYGPMAALALGTASYLTQIQGGEDIDFYIVNNDNVNLFLGGYEFYYIKKGKVLNDFSQMTAPLRGSYHVCLSNDNAVTGVNVTVKITAIEIKEQWGKREIQVPKVSSREEPYLKN